MAGSGAAQDAFLFWTVLKPLKTAGWKVHRLSQSDIFGSAATSDSFLRLGKGLLAHPSVRGGTHKCPTYFVPGVVPGTH
jgi:hypothetical protein